jgi:methylthioribose-1-phosphate isomerase
MMRPLSSLGLRSDGARVELLDQRFLPDEARWVDATNPHDMADCIRTLAVRGAPLLGVSGAVCLGTHGRPPRGPRGHSSRRRAAPRRAPHRGEPRGHGRPGHGEAMATHGGALLADGDGVLTHCNTGGLATVGVGTALGVVIRAWERGTRLHVYVDETRPLLQGGRLTAWELQRAGIPFTLLTDSMAALVMRAGKVQRVLVGADRIARNGDFANKVGTYGVAVLAKHHGVPFHPVAPWTTVDLACACGDDIEIEQRDAAEVRGVRGSFGAVRWAPEGCAVFNPAFDVTPAALVTSLVLDRGVFTPEAFAAHCARG